MIARTDARVTALAGIAYVALSLVSQSLMQIGGMEPAFDAPAGDIVAFFEARDPALFAVGGYLHLLALATFLWFLGGLWSLLRGAEGGPGWRSTIVGVSGLAFLGSANGGWQLAMLRQDALDPVTAQLAFDLGNVGFANSWMPLASMLVAASLAMRHVRIGPGWLSGLALVVGVGLLAARMVWTSQAAFAPWVGFWVWVVALAVVLLRRRPLVRAERPEAAAAAGP